MEPSHRPSALSVINPQRVRLAIAVLKQARHGGWGAMRLITRRQLTLGAAAATMTMGRKAIAQTPDVTDVAVGFFFPGAPLHRPQLIEALELIGRKPAFFSWFVAWDPQPDPASTLPDLEAMELITNLGIVPMITWEPWDPLMGADQPFFAPERIANGHFDDYVRAWATAIADWGKPIYLRVFHELNASWYPWGTQNDPRHLVDAWRYLHMRFREAGARNVRWVWCPDASLGDVDLRALYPGDAYVDWLGLDGYNWGDVRPESGWRSFGEIIGPVYGGITALADKPLMIAETASVEQGGDKAEWIATAYASLPTAFPRIKAINWFNDVTQGADWRVDTSRPALDAFRAAIATPSMQGVLP